MRRECEWCRIGIVSHRADARFCSTQHRIYAHRAAKANPIPTELVRNDRWIRYSSKKVPLTVHGTAASSTDPSTWSSHQAALASKAGVGLGYVLGEGIGCIDLDHCLIDGQPNDQAAAFIAKYPSNYIEVSPSGDGLHIWGLREPQAGTKETIDGLSIETYSIGRYMTVTGNVLQHGTLAAL